MLCPKSKRNEKTLPQTPLVLTIESKVVRSNMLRGMKRKGLNQQSKIRVRISRINPALKKSVQALGIQIPSTAKAVGVEIPMSSFKACPKSQLLVAPRFHQVAGKLIQRVGLSASPAVAQLEKWQRSVEVQPCGERR